MRVPGFARGRAKQGFVPAACGPGPPDAFKELQKKAKESLEMLTRCVQIVDRFLRASGLKSSFKPAFVQRGVATRILVAV